MTSSSALPALPVAMPLLGAALLAAFRKWLGRALTDAFSVAVAAGCLVVAILLVIQSRHGTEVYWFGNWYPRGTMVLGIVFTVDRAGAALACLAAFLTLLALLFSWRYVEAGANHFQPLMLIFLAAMSGFVLTGDLFNMFVFFELMSTAAFALCGLKTAEPAPLQGSFNFAVTNTIAAFFVLTGIAMLYALTGALNMAQIGLAIGTRHDPTVLFAFTLLTCGFLIKAAIAPFHLWLPDAHAVAPTPVCVLFSGIMVELGLYAVIRLHTAIFAGALAAHSGQVRAILLAFATMTVLIGGVMCYAEHHVKRVLAFSTVCHAGLMLAAWAIGGPLALAAMLVYLFAHALIKAGLFFCAGILLHRLRSISEKVLFGRGKKMRWTAALWFLGGAGLAGAPPMGIMLAEAGVTKAAQQSGVEWVSALFILGGAMTGAAVFRIGMHTFLGWGAEPITDESADVGELPETKEKRKLIQWYHFMPAAICIVGSLVMVFVPGWLLFLREAAAALNNQALYIQTVYSGQAATRQVSGWQDALGQGALHGATAVTLAILLACSSVFRERIVRPLRLGAYLEGRMGPLRAIQSGHPGDYVTWITVGIALFGSAAMLLLRS